MFTSLVKSNVESYSPSNWTCEYIGINYWTHITRKIVWSTREKGGKIRGLNLERYHSKSLHVIFNGFVSMLQIILERSAVVFLFSVKQVLKAAMEPRGYVVECTTSNLKIVSLVLGPESVGRPGVLIDLMCTWLKPRNVKAARHRHDHTTFYMPRSHKQTLVLQAVRLTHIVHGLLIYSGEFKMSNRYQSLLCFFVSLSTGQYILVISRAKIISLYPIADCVHVQFVTGTFTVNSLSARPY